MTRTRIWRAALAALVLVPVVVGCDNSDPTGPATSQSVISNVQVRPLTGQFSNRLVQYRITSTATNPAGLVGGVAQLKTAALPQARRSMAAIVGQVVAKAPVTANDVVGTELRVVLEFNRPPVGVMHLNFSVVDAQGLETNEIPLVIGIDKPPPPPPPPPAPPSFAQTIGPTFLHPRCTNCHGFQVPNAIGTAHVGRPPTCSLCHTVPNWHAPAPSFDLAGKSLPQICEMAKSTQGNNPAVIDNHLKNDTLIQWAINDATVLGNLQPGGKAPPGALGPWNDLINQWIAGGMSCG